MIHDATVEITCDGKNCRSSIVVDLPVGARNTYLASDDAIGRQAKREEWIVKDGEHFCCEECVSSHLTGENE